MGAGSITHAFGSALCSARCRGECVVSGVESTRSHHFFTTDSEGSLYVGEDMAYRIQKFVPRKDGNPVQIIGPLMQ